MKAYENYFISHTYVCMWFLQFFFFFFNGSDQVATNNYPSSMLKMINGNRIAGIKSGKKTNGEQVRIVCCGTLRPFNDYSTRSQIPRRIQRSASLVDPASLPPLRDGNKEDAKRGSVSSSCPICGASNPYLTGSGPRIYFIEAERRFALVLGSSSPPPSAETSCHLRWRRRLSLWEKGLRMTVGAGISVSDGDLVALGTKILSQVHENVLLSPASRCGVINAAFVGVRSERGGSRNVFPIGKLL